MKADRLLAHYDRIADAPDAVPRLRRFVLDLAVRGKLVPQDPNDDPASELLKRIAAARKDPPTAGQSGKKQLADLSLAELPFALPKGWTETRLSELVRVVNGRAYKKPELLDQGTPVLRVGNLFTSDRWYYSNLELEEDKYCEKGDLIYAWSASFGPFIWNGPRVIYHYHIWKLPLFSEADVDKQFLYLFLLQKTREIKNAGHGISMVHMTKEKMEQLAVPLPPHAEQRRIVAKVSELMALCDRLEAAQQTREAARDRLTAASLARLSAPAPETFRDDARFALDALPALTARADQIKQLRQTILDLAIRGKLVPQHPNDEPASELLKRILALPWATKRKLSDLEPDNNALAEAFPLPQGWEWASVDTLVRPNETVTYGILKPEWVADGVPTVRVTEMKTGAIDVASLPKCDRARAAKFQKTTLAPGDLLVSKDGTIGKTAFVPPELAGGNITQHMLRFPICDLVNSQYVRLTIDAPFCQSWMAGETKGVALQGVNVGDFRRMPIPLPPLAEQHRIVAKVDALMALCDRLVASVTAAADNRGRLLEALLAEALAPEKERDLEAAE